MKKWGITLLAIVTSFLSSADLFTPGTEMGTQPAEILLIARTEAEGSGQTEGVWLQIEDVNFVQSILRPDVGTVGIGQAWYEAAVDTVIDADFVLTAPLFYDNRGSPSGEIQMRRDQSFIMGFWLEGATNVYGWAELVYDGTTLNLLDSAAENSGVGIIAGKYEVVPEPATVLLFGLGGFGAWLLRRNRRVL